MGDDVVCEVFGGRSGGCGCEETADEGLEGSCLLLRFRLGSLICVEEKEEVAVPVLMLMESRVLWF